MLQGSDGVLFGRDLLSYRVKLVVDSLKALFCLVDLGGGFGAGNVGLIITSSPKGEHLCHLVSDVSEVLVNLEDVAFVIDFQIVNSRILLTVSRRCWPN